MATRRTRVPAGEALNSHRPGQSAMPPLQRLAEIDLNRDLPFVPINANDGTAQWAI
jgi:hypothetical protein